MRLLYLPFLLFSISLSHAGAKIKIEKYATNGRLTRDALVNFIIDYRDIPYAKLRPAGTVMEPTMVSKLTFPEISDALRDIRPGSWPEGTSVSIAEVRALLPAVPPEAQAFEALPAWRKVPPLTTPYFTKQQTYSKVDGTKVTSPVFSGNIAEVIREEQEFKKNDPALESATDRNAPWHQSSLGPFRLRRSVESVFNYAVGDDASAFYSIESAGGDKELLAAPGARLSYSDNRLVDKGGKWSTEGSLIFPYHRYAEKVWRQREDGTSLEDAWELVHVALAGSWKVERAEGSGSYNVNELKFSAPLVYGHSGLGFLQFNPYYQTDTDFDGAIFGATASFELFREPCFGRYDKITEIGNRELDYRVRVAALLDYSEVTTASRYSARKSGDDWLRAGGEFGLEFGLFDKDEPKKLPITANVSYRFMDSISGVEDDGHMLKAGISLWLSRFASFTLNYEKGETPVAAKEVDMFTAGIELRY